MARRDLLHLTKLLKFKEWMEEDGWESVPVKGEYEVLRLIKLKEKPVIFYSRLGGQHASIDDNFVPLVRRFLNKDKKVN